jgi:hypothetical protein
LFDDFLNLIIFQPGVDDLELLTQNLQHHNLGEVLSVAVGGVLFGIEIDYFPL